jgi:hypothetical protein
MTGLMQLTHRSLARVCGYAAARNLLQKDVDQRRDTPRVWFVTLRQMLVRSTSCGCRADLHTCHVLDGALENRNGGRVATEQHKGRFQSMNRRVVPLCE